MTLAQTTSSKLESVQVWLLTCVLVGALSSSFHSATMKNRKISKRYFLSCDLSQSSRLARTEKIIEQQWRYEYNRAAIT